jgi:hypothetical protein
MRMSQLSEVMRDRTESANLARLTQGLAIEHNGLRSTEVALAARTTLTSVPRVQFHRSVHDLRLYYLSSNRLWCSSTALMMESAERIAS